MGLQRGQTRWPGDGVCAPCRCGQWPFHVWPVRHAWGPMAIPSTANPQLIPQLTCRSRGSPSRPSAESDWERQGRVWVSGAGPSRWER
jgi:hypothetical protein